jgi:hypothetical protein
MDMEADVARAMVDEGLTCRRQGAMALNWNQRRALRYAPDRPPAEWPENVRPISEVGLGLFGIEPETNQLYWDGKEVILRDRIRFERFERVLASVGVFSAFGAFIGTFGYFVLELGKLMKWWG